YYWQKQFAKALSYYSGEALNEREFPSEQDRTDFADALKKDAEAAEWTVILLRKSRRMEDAAQKVNEALSRFPPTSGLLGEKAVTFYSNGRYDEAIELFDRALKLDEYESFNHQWRAACFRKQGKFDEARKAILEALKKLPTSPGLWEELAWVSFDQNDLKKANEYFARAIELDPYVIRRQFSRVELLIR